MNSLLSAEMRAKVMKRGLAYECIKCGPAFRGEKRYVRAHIYKYHVSLDEVPFYCRLCHYMSDSEKDLIKHTKGYKPHRLAEEHLKAEGRTPDSNYIHKNPNPVELGEVHLRKLSPEDSQLVWLARIKEAGPQQATEEQDSAVDSMEVDPQPTSEEEQAVPDPLCKMPEPLREKESEVPVISLPDIVLPETTEEEEDDLLAGILRDESIQAAEEFPEEEVQVTAGAGILSQILQCMQDIRKEAIQTNQLLTVLNTGIRKNTMMMDELASSIRAQERRIRDQRERASPYWRPRSVVTIPKKRAGARRSDDRNKRH